MNPEVEVLRRELEEAFAGRAHLYREMLDGLEAELGAERAEALMRKVLEKRGAAAAGQLFKGCAATPQAVGARFLSVSPDGGRMYPHSVADDGAALHVKVARCPLKDAWVGAGLAASAGRAALRHRGRVRQGPVRGGGRRVCQRDVEPAARRRMLLDQPLTGVSG